MCSVSNVRHVQWTIPQTRDEGSMLIQVRAFLVAHTRGVAATNVRIQNMQICHSLGCKQIDISTADQFTLVTRRPYCPGRPKKLCFTTLSLAMETMGMRLSVVKQSFLGPPGQYGRLVTRANSQRLYEVMPQCLYTLCKVILQR